jgi:hypothetical protein
MSKKLVVVIALVAALGIPWLAVAHTGHTHKIMGTVSAIHDKHVEVTTRDGKVTGVTLDDKTVFRQGKAKVDVTSLKVGERVVVEGLQPDGAKTITARTVRLGAAPAVARKSAVGSRQKR